MEISTILSIVGVVLGSGGMLTAFIAWKKAPAENRVLEAGAYESMSATITILSKRVSDLEEEGRTNYAHIMKQNKEIQSLNRNIFKLERLVVNLRNGIDILIKQIIDAGGTPNWLPDQESKK